MVKKEDSDGITQYSYNPKQQLTSVVTPAGDVQKNWYDPEGLRTAMLEQGTRTEFIFWGEDVLTEERKECSERIRYFKGYGIEGCDWGEKRYYYAKDEQFSTFLITGMDGRIVNQYRYDSFGQENECEETIPNRFRYTGQQYDSVTEQYYLRARYYSPALGRFLQEDVYRGDGLNLYAYCRNNPVLYYDPSGYAEIDFSKIPKDISFLPFRTALKEQGYTANSTEASKLYWQHTDKNRDFDARQTYMGNTPQISSSVGKEVLQRMYKNGYINIERIEDQTILKKIVENKEGFKTLTADEIKSLYSQVEFKSKTDNKFYRLSEANMAHKNIKSHPNETSIHTGNKQHLDAVDFWNKIGRFTGAKSK